MAHRFIQFHKHLLSTSCLQNASRRRHGSGRYRGKACHQGPQDLPGRHPLIEIRKSNQEEFWLWEFLTKFSISRAVTGRPERPILSWSSSYQTGHILFLHHLISLIAEPAQLWQGETITRQRWHVARAEAMLAVSRSRARPPPTHKLYEMPTMCRERWWIQR